ncbi:hypothetical protein ABT224_33540 [Streptomyces sp. NPDC001584]|uniref:hypothetical protein n=1 Tax=Streptomyces sp. NPDC001584 TaxID=3154521 RepID=UPI003327FA0C
MVTRETLGQSSQPVGPEPQPFPAQATKTASPPGPAIPTTVHEILPDEIRRALVEELPQESTPNEVITACEKRLHAAQYLREAMEQRALGAYFHYAGPAVRLAHKGSWRHITDPSTGKPCRSWSAWLRAVKVSRQHAFRMVKVEPLMEALAGLDTGPLGVRQIDVLSPVLINHGKDKVRLLWDTAAEKNDTSAVSLERVRDQLGLAVDAKAGGDDDDDESRSVTPVLRFQGSPGTFDEGRVREVARAQPEVSLLVARTILSELGEDPATQ